MVCKRQFSPWPPRGRRIIFRHFSRLNRAFQKRTLRVRSADNLARKLALTPRNLLHASIRGHQSGNPYFIADNLALVAIWHVNALMCEPRIPTASLILRLCNFCLFTAIASAVNLRFKRTGGVIFRAVQVKSGLLVSAALTSKVRQFHVVIVLGAGKKWAEYTERAAEQSLPGLHFVMKRSPVHQMPYSY